MTSASVLVVDDEIAALTSARAALSGAGYTVNEALGGRRALQQIMVNPPHVLITKICMPDGDGIELIGAAKRTHPDMRIIAVTDRRFLGGLDLLDLARKLGADATLDKPFKTEGLLAVVARLVSSQSPAGLI